jgi:MraZ protein
MEMLLGAYEHSLDDKNRVTLPAKFRQAFAKGVFVSKGLDPCLVVYSPEGWNALVEGRMAGLDPFSSEARKMSRYLFANASEAVPDKQGRISLPATLLAHASLKREVVVAGLRDHLELWEPKAWHAEIDDVGRSAGDVAERLAGSTS